jgi:hypothetical protein
MLKKLIITSSLIAYLLSTTACGVILYPERQGQKGGKIDLAVAFLDGIGLFLYIVPGLVAFAVDFHQGTIYLPNTRAQIDAGEPEFREVKIDFNVDEKPLTVDQLESVLQRELGFPINLDDERAFVMKLDSLDQLAIQQLAQMTVSPRG